MKRRTILLLLSAVLICVISVSGALAYLNAHTPTKDNELAFETGKVEITENFDGWNTKEVSLKNTSDKIPGVVRAMLLPRVVDANGNYVATDLGTLGEPTEGKIVCGDFTFEMADNWSDNWFYKDGFFYCKKVLAAGETSPLLLKKVSLTADSAEVRERYKDLDIKVDVIAALLQSEGGAPETEWGVTVSGNAVSAS